MSRRMLILDGLQDADVARGVSARLSGAGLDNRLDLGAQLLEVEAEADDPRIEGILAQFGLVPRVESREAWRRRLGRCCLVLIALALLGAAVEVVIAAGMVGAGWRLGHVVLLLGALYAGEPVITQALAAARALRPSGDLLTSLVMAIAAGLAVGDAAGWAAAEGGAAAMPLAVAALALAMGQRWLSHRMAEHLAGRADAMLRWWHRLVGGWVAGSAVVGIVAGWPWLMALLLVLPPMLALGAINPWTPRWQMALAPLAFAVVLAGPAGALGAVESRPWPHPLPPLLPGVVAVVFQCVMVSVMALGWWATAPRPRNADQE